MYYKKTAKGQAEIEASARQLPQTLRMVLVLVDGQRSASALQQMLAAATPQALQSLLEAGYIEAAVVLSKRSRSAQRSVAAPVDAAAPAPRSTPAPFKSSGMPSSYDVATRPENEAATDAQRAQIERSLQRALGPTADSLVKTVRQAHTVGELVEVLKSAQRVISNARGKDIADEFASRYGSLDGT